MRGLADAALACASHLQRGREHLAAGRYRAAAAALWQAYRQARRAADAALMAQALNGLGYAYCELGDPLRAEQVILRALSLAGVPALVRGKLLLDLGVARYQQGDDAGAQRCWLQAARWFRRVGEARLGARCRANLGLLHLERRPRRARRLLEAALATLEREGDPLRHRVHTELARVYLQLGQVPAAHAAAERAWEGAVAARDVVELGRVLAVLAELEHAAGRPERARAHFAEALAILGRHDPWELKRCHERAARLGYAVSPHVP